MVIGCRSAKARAQAGDVRVYTNAAEALNIARASVRSTDRLTVHV